MIRLHKIENSIFESNTFIVWHRINKKCCIVDCGDSSEILKFLEVNNLTLESIFITHGHYDHIYGLNDIVEKYPHVKIYASKEAIEELYDDKLNYSRYYDDSFTFKGMREMLFPVVEGQKIEVMDNSAEVECVMTPGHNDGCVTFLLHDYIFTGDSYIPGLRTITNLRGNKAQAIESEKRIKEIINTKGLIVCPGHGDIPNGLITAL